MSDTQKSSEADSQRIAARVRGLIGGQDGGNLAVVATRLGVSELSLRLTIDESSPQPTLAVLLAIIREYAVDPTWLLTGQYDAATHRQAMATDRAAAAEALRQVAARQITEDGIPLLHLIADSRKTAN
jgi:hypothetical protein